MSDSFMDREKILGGWRGCCGCLVVLGIAGLVLLAVMLSQTIGL